MQPGNLAYAIRLNVLTGAFGTSTSGPGAALMAGGVIYQELNRQATAQAYQDIYRLLSWMAIGMVACAFLLKKNKPAQEASAKNAMH